MKKRETYIVNGKRFFSMDDVDTYCKENNFRITNTETFSPKGDKIHIISVHGIDYAEQVKFEV